MNTNIEEIKIKVELLLIIESKKEWIRKIPRHLPAKTTRAEEHIWLDKNGYSMIIGEDFSAAEELKSYPVKVYRRIRAVEAL